MHKDLEYIEQSLRSLIKAQIESPSNETPMFFNNIHLSPLKVLQETPRLRFACCICLYFMVDSRQFFHAWIKIS